jgi:hypothetical protein
MILNNTLVHNHYPWYVDSIERLRQELEKAEALRAEERSRKEESAEILTASCLQCHQMSSFRLAPVTAAKPVLARARFAHEPHLSKADCLRCHEGVERSRDSRDLVFKGVQSCRECHKPRGASPSCATCHRFHPPERS